MKNYIYAPLWTQELEDKIENDSRTKPLIMEFFYKYGLKVMGTVSVGGHLNRTGFVMTIEGMPYCTLYTSMEPKKNDKYGDPVLTFCYHSIYYTKGRGRDAIDKQTLKSSKLSSLMRTIDANDAIPTFAQVFQGRYVLEQMEGYVRQSIEGDSSKNVNLMRPEDLHWVLKVISGDILKMDMPETTNIRCKEILDEFNKADETRAKRKEAIDAWFTNPFYMIGVNDDKGYVIGKLQAKRNAEGKMDFRELEVLVPFQKVFAMEEYDDYTNLSPLWTMFKVYAEGRKDVHRNLQHIPITDAYHDVGAVTYYQRSPDEYNHAWLLLPTVVV